MQLEISAYLERVRLRLHHWDDDTKPPRAALAQWYIVRFSMWNRLFDPRATEWIAVALFGQ